MQNKQCPFRATSDIHVSATLKYWPKVGGFISSVHARMQTYLTSMVYTYLHHYVTDLETRFYNAAVPDLSSWRKRVYLPQRLFN